MELGNIKGYTVRFQLCTVPGQVFYNETRKLVLRGVDGIVFVCDSQWSMLSHNLESFQNLKENLAEADIALDSIPVVIQYNKRDLQGVLSVDALQTSLGFQQYPYVEAVAHDGVGVVDTFKLVSKLTFVDLLRRLQKGGMLDEDAFSSTNPQQAAEARGPFAVATASAPLTAVEDGSARFAPRSDRRLVAPPPTQDMPFDVSGAWPRKEPVRASGDVFDDSVVGGVAPLRAVPPLPPPGPVAPEPPDIFDPAEATGGPAPAPAGLVSVAPTFDTSAADALRADLRTLSAELQGLNERVADLAGRQVVSPPALDALARKLTADLAGEHASLSGLLDPLRAELHALRGALASQAERHDHTLTETRSTLAAMLAEKVSDGMTAVRQEWQNAPFVTRDALSSFVTREALSSLVTRDALSSFVTRDDLAGFLPQAAAESFVTQEVLRPFVKTEALEPYATREALADAIRAARDEVRSELLRTLEEQLAPLRAAAQRPPDATSEAFLALRESVARERDEMQATLRAVHEESRGDFRRLEQLFGAFRDELNTHGAGLASGLRSQRDGLDAAQAANAAALEGVRGEVGGSLEELRTAISALSDVVEREIGKPDPALPAVEGRLAALGQELSRIAADRESVDGRVLAFEERLSGLQASTEEIVSRRIGTFEERLVALQTSIEGSVSQRLTSLQSSTDENVSRRLSELRSATEESVSQRLSALQSSTEEGLSRRLSALEAQIQSLAQASDEASRAARERLDKAEVRSRGLFDALRKALADDERI